MSACKKGQREASVPPTIHLGCRGGKGALFERGLHKESPQLRGGRGLARMRTKVDRVRKGDLPVCGCPFQRVFKGHVMILFRCSTMENRNSLRKYFKELLFFDSFCSSLIVFQFSVRMNRGRVEQEAAGVEMGREGVENWHTCADVPYG